MTAPYLLKGLRRDSAWIDLDWHGVRFLCRPLTTVRAETARAARDAAMARLSDEPEAVLADYGLDPEDLGDLDDASVRDGFAQLVWATEVAVALVEAIEGVDIVGEGPAAPSRAVFALLFQNLELSFAFRLRVLASPDLTAHEREGNGSGLSSLGASEAGPTIAEAAA